MNKIERFCDEVFAQLSQEHVKIIQVERNTKDDPTRPKEFEAWAGGYLMGLQFCFGIVSTLRGEKQDSPASHK